MHPSVIDFLKWAVLKSDIEDYDVLEVGAQDVNGSPREVLIPLKPKKYLGVDFAAGRGVDQVLDVAKLTSKLGYNTFDVVVSTEMLEHAQDWRTAVNQMKDVLKLGGLLLITTRGPGFPYHGYPHDYWRYEREHFLKIFADMEILTLQDDPQFPGVFLKARKIVGTGFVDLSQIEVRKV